MLIPCSMTSANAELMLHVLFPRYFNKQVNAAQIKTQMQYSFNLKASDVKFGENS